MYRLRSYLKDQPAGLLGIGLCSSLRFPPVTVVWSWPGHTHHLQLCWERPDLQLQPLFFVASTRRAPCGLFGKYLQTQRQIWHFWLLGTFRRQVLSHTNCNHQGHSQWAPPADGASLSVPRALDCPSTPTLPPRVVGCKWTEWLGFRRCVKWLLSVDTPPWCFLVNAAFNSWQS